ncbi:NADH:ubiquinone reductase (Na(+)-transporting) subunit B [bacterium]|jgi:Na+-transporting NADH:ubiquinone oxidoreductase subunit B|nr:NADH:ubiquinone reductase (Na(+)-transporting) subunit B [bacterium]
MKWLKDKLDAQEKHFVSGGKLEKLYPLFEAVHTIHFSTTAVTKIGAHIRDSLDTKRYMIIVVMALLPTMGFGVYNAGLQTQLAGGLSTDTLSSVLQGLKIFLPILLVTFAVGGFWEVIFAVFRGHEINEGFLVSGMLFPLIVPPTIPLWQVALGISFGVVVGKEVFGGTGRNFLNPALTGRAFLFFSYPAYMSGDAVWTLVSVAKDRVVDTFSGATPLAIAAQVEAPNSVVGVLTEQGFSLSNLFWGTYAGSIGETSVFCILLGAALLIATGIGSWRVMVGSVLGGVLMTTVFNVFSGPTNLPFLHLGPLWHLMMGGFMFGIVFMATDPVSAPDLKASKWVYGLLIGILAIIIRTINPAYPEGVMLAILLMNVFAPLIDHVVLQRKVKKRIPNVI